MNNLPSEAFLLLGISALHGDGWLSLAALNELLCLLGEGRKKKKAKIKDTCNNSQSSLWLSLHLTTAWLMAGVLKFRLCKILIPSRGLACILGKHIAVPSDTKQTEGTTLLPVLQGHQGQARLGICIWSNLKQIPTSGKAASFYQVLFCPPPTYAQQKKQCRTSWHC